MKKILIVGAGAMGAAFSIPLLDNGHSVTLTEPYNFKLLQKLNLKKKIHPSLNINLPQKLKINKFSSDILNQKWDLIVIAVSSIGIDLIGQNLSKIKNKSPILVLTKGLKLDGRNLISMSSLLKKYNKNLNISVLKGPCLAKELAKKVKSFTVVANKNINTAKKIANMLNTNYYHTSFSDDLNGVEVSAAIKNIFSMAVGAAKGLCGKNISNEVREKNYLNTASALIKQSIFEMEIFVEHLKGKKETVKGLAGLGDLYVSSGGGRNAKMGAYIGEGLTFSEAKKTKMEKVTVEGADLAKELSLIHI